MEFLSENSLVENGANQIERKDCYLVKYFQAQSTRHKATL